jgi:transposase
MEKIDARKLSAEVLQERRMMAIKLRKRGISNKEVAEIVGISATTVSQYWSRYQKEGSSGLKLKKRGRSKGDGKTLDDAQEREIIALLVSKNPKQLEFPFALWTRESVKALIDREYEMDIPISTVGRYLKKWEFTAKKPIKRAYERSDAKAKAWMEQDYPRIQEEAKKEHADIWWADETSCVSLPTNLKGYAPKGEKPLLIHPAKKFRINMISAITNTGKTMFALYDEAINTDRFIGFLEKTIASSEKKIYLILDNLRVHHAKVVKEWIEEHKEKIELFFLPAYSPDLNPDEYLNQDYKKNANKRQVPTTKKQLEKNTKAYMESLQGNPEKVANFFQHPAVQYASGF